MKKKTWHVYILRTRLKTLYTGIALDVKKRLKQHAENRGSRYLRGKAPLELVYLEKYRTKSAALKREIKIKKLSRLQKMSLIQTYKSISYPSFPRVFSGNQFDPRLRGDDIR